MIEILKKYITSKNLLFAIGIILFIIFITQMQEITLMFFASYVIACSLNPLVDRLSKKFKRSTSAFIILMGALLSLIIFFIPLVILVSDQINTFIASFPQHLNKLNTILHTSPILRHANLTRLDINQLLPSATSFTTDFMANIIAIGKNIGSAFIYLLASILIVFYFMADKKAINKTYLSLFPQQMKRKAKNVLEIISKKIGGYIVGQIAAIASVWVIMTIGLLLIHNDYAILLGFITAVLDIIPVVGPAIALVICLAVSYEAGPLALGLIIIIFSTAQLVENNFVRPYVFGKLLNLHPILIYLFLFITAKYMGIIGVLFAPAIAATVCVLVEEIYIKNINKESIKPE